MTDDTQDHSTQDHSTQDHSTKFAHASLLDALETAERDVASYFGTVSAHDWALRKDAAWTAGEHLQHLNTAVSAVARGFAMPRLVLRLRFGRSRRKSRTFDALRDDYLARLSGGAGATGPFVPKRVATNAGENDANRLQVLERWKRVNARLRTALLPWSERDLDRIQLPHPILGRITAREMIFFTIYHNGHHIRAARSRLP